MRTDVESPPVRVAVVGSGPSGAYAAGFLLAAPAAIEVDVFERLPTPWGLVRAGVAPDHPNIKSVTRVYEKTAAIPGFRFLGNVDVGRDVTLDELARHYHAIVLAVGAAADRTMGVPGEDLPGSWSATQFVAWYNGHPDHRDEAFDLSCERAVVVGNGNVAMDVARMLVLDPDELAVTDVADHALAALRASAIREVVVLGRRGPVQAAFTNPELLELGELGGADVVIDPADLELDAAASAALESATPTARRNLETLRELAARPPKGAPKRIVLRFLASPVALNGAERVESVTVARNELVDDGRGGLRARPTSRRETLPAGLVLRSIGYRGLPVPGLPFDGERGVVPNDGARVLGPGGAPLPGRYVTGWIKRGPTGIIGTNKKDARETVAALLDDLGHGRLPEPPEPERDALAHRLEQRGVDVVSYEGWQAIDRHERDLGEPQGRPRCKLTTIPALLDAARR